MRAPDFWNSDGLAARLLSPLGALYGGSVRARQLRAHPFRSKARVLCVGNLTAGGSGKTPIAITVLSNGVLGYQKDAEDVKFGRHTSACHFTPVDHAAIARACGCRGVSIKKASDYLPALREALSLNETTVLDVDTDPQAYPPITVFDDKLDAMRKERGA